MIAVFARIRSKPGKRDELIAALLPGVADAEAEPGTLVMAMHADLRDENALHFYEVYESKEAFITHAKVAGPKLNAMSDLLDGPPELMQALPIGSIGLDALAAGA